MYIVEHPLYGLRAGLDKYYSIFPDAFDAHQVRDQGLWLPFISNITAIENVSDFGFRYQEGGGDPTDCKILNQNNILIFPYIEPHLVHWPLPPHTPLDDAHVEASIADCVNNPDKYPPQQKRDCVAVQRYAARDLSGKYLWVPEVAPWNVGVMFSLDINSAFVSDPDSRCSDELDVVAGELMNAKAGNYELGGIYIDSTDGSELLLNYNPISLAHSRSPLLVDNQGAPVTLLAQGTLSFLQYLRDELSAQGSGLELMGNTLYVLPHLQFSAVFSVAGIETNWHPSETMEISKVDALHTLYGGKSNVSQRILKPAWPGMLKAPDHYDFPTSLPWLTPPPRPDMFFQRALAAQRPYIFLQNTDFNLWSYDMTDQYFQICLSLGIWPSFFSHNGADHQYFANATLYNRDRALFRKYIPILREINYMGWQPLTFASVSPSSSPSTNQYLSEEDINAGESSFYIERFGPLSENSSKVIHDLLEGNDLVQGDQVSGQARRVYLGAYERDEIVVCFSLRNEGRADVLKTMTLNITCGEFGIRSGRVIVEELTTVSPAISVPVIDGLALVEFSSSGVFIPPPGPNITYVVRLKGNSSL